MSALTKGNITRGGIAPMLWLLGSLAILSALFRIVVTTQALLTGVPPADPSDVHYVEHPWLTALHILPGTVFLLLGPLQFVSSFRARWPKWHRYSGRVLIASGLIVAVSSIILNLVFPPVGGLFKSLAVFIFSVALFGSLLVALHAILHRNIARHRAWMIRAFAIGLAVSTMRIFFIPAYFLYGIPSEFTIGLGMWVGFLVNTCVAEFILWRGASKLS